MPRASLHKIGTYRRMGLQPSEMQSRMSKTADMIVLCHLGVPMLDPGTWTLTIEGMVRKPRCFMLDELRRMPQTTITALHQCAGNPLEPQIPTQRICNVTWTGVSLASILGECEVDAAASFVWSFGADHGSFAGVDVETYVKDLPIARLAEDVLIAFEVNGEALPLEHGFPARLVVPGFYGTNSVKWLTKIVLADRRALGPFTTHWYNDPVDGKDGQSTGDKEPVWRIAPQSIIVVPGPEGSARAGAATDVWGWAWADGGVCHVEVSTDGGRRWRPANLEQAQGRGWQKFAYTWTPEMRGSHSVQSRARSRDGSVQPVSGKRNAIYSVSITVV